MGASPNRVPIVDETAEAAVLLRGTCRLSRSLNGYGREKNCRTCLRDRHFAAVP
jgi:hypothetical protein